MYVTNLVLAQALSAVKVSCGIGEPLWLSGKVVKMRK
jgi:hypothetical protein